MACSRRQRRQGKTVLSRPCRRCERDIMLPSLAFLSRVLRKSPRSVYLIAFLESVQGRRKRPGNMSRGKVRFPVYNCASFQSAQMCWECNPFCSSSLVLIDSHDFLGSMSTLRLRSLHSLNVSKPGHKQDAVTSVNFLSMVTKYTPPRCRSRYVWHVKQNGRSKYGNEQA